MLLDGIGRPRDHGAGLDAQGRHDVAADLEGSAGVTRVMMGGGAHIVSLHPGVPFSTDC